jgi:hypothetical protein
VLLKHSLDVGFLGIKGEVSNVQLDFILPSRVETCSPAGSRAGTAFTLGTRFVDTNGTSIQLRLVHLRNSTFRSIPSAQGHEPESTRTRRGALNRQKDFGDSSKLRELGAKLGFIGGCSKENQEPEGNAGQASQSNESKRTTTTIGSLKKTLDQRTIIQISDIELHFFSIRPSTGRTIRISGSRMMLIIRRGSATIRGTRTRTISHCLYSFLAFVILQ